MLNETEGTDTELVLEAERPRSGNPVEALSEMLGKLGDTVTELNDILCPVGISSDVLRPLGMLVNDSVTEVRNGS